METEGAGKFVLGQWNPWPLTPRTRFIVWLNVQDIADDFDVLFRQEWQKGEPGPEPERENLLAMTILDYFPPLVRSQPREWWVQVERAARRMKEAMRTGEKWNPRTPAEEAVLYIATQNTATAWEDGQESGVGADLIAMDESLAAVRGASQGHQGRAGLRLGRGPRRARWRRGHLDAVVTALGRHRGPQERDQPGHADWGLPPAVVASAFPRLPDRL